MFGRDQHVFYMGEKITIKDLVKKIKPRDKYLVVVSNDESIIAEAKNYFRGFKTLIEVNQKIFPTNQLALEMIIRQILRTIAFQTHQRDLIVFVFSAPCIIPALLAIKLSKSSRFILFAQFDLYSKTYHVYEIDKPT